MFVNLFSICVSFTNCLMMYRRNQIKLLPFNCFIDNLFNTTANHSIRHVTKLVDKAVLHEDVNQMINKGMNPRHHPGRRKLPQVNLPTILESAALKVLSKYKKSQLKDDVHRLFHQLQHRQLPPEAAEIQEKYKEIEHRYSTQDDSIVAHLDPHVREETLRARQEKIQAALKREIYNWQPIKYDEYNSVVYMAGRLVPNFAITKSVLYEIKCSYPSFQPKTLFDFGSGVGTTIWAANEIWPRSFSEYFCVDISKEAHDIARLLLKQGEENKPLVHEGIFTRQFLPVTSDVKYDIVVSAFSLLELPSFQARVQTIENLWHKTEGFLVFIENGKKPGFSAVLEARNLILQITGHKVTETFNVDSSFQEVIQLDDDEIPSSNVLAPCPHNYPCPKLFTGQIKPCNFSVSFNHLQFADLRRVLCNNKEDFSYCIIQKKKATFEDQPSWPRVISNISKKQKSAICKLCCPDGTIKDFRFSKSKDSRNLFYVAKLSKWSDLLPVTIQKVEKVITTDDDIDATLDEVDDDLDGNSDENSDSEGQSNLLNQISNQSDKLKVDRNLSS